MITMKAGRYRLADVPTLSGNIGYLFDGTFEVTTTVPNIGEVWLECTDFYVEDTGSISYKITRTVPDLTEYGITLPMEPYVYHGSEGRWDTESYGEGIQYITVPYDQSMPIQNHEWFQANVIMLNRNGKSGVTIEWDGDREGTPSIPLPGVPEYVLYRVSDRIFTAEELSEYAYWYSDRNYYSPNWSTYETWDRMATEIMNEHVYQLKEVYVCVSDYVIDGMTVPPGVYFLTDATGTTDVPYITKLMLPNADEEVEHMPAAAVSYNGAIIAQLDEGQTATLKCKGMVMESDVVISTVSAS